MKTLAALSLLIALTAAQGTLYHWDWVHYPEPTSQPKDDTATIKKLIDVQSLFNWNINAWFFGAGFDIDIDADYGYTAPTVKTTDFYAQQLNMFLSLGSRNYVYGFIGKTKLTVFLEADVGKAIIPMEVKFDLTNMQICVEMKYDISAL